MKLRNPTEINGVKFDFVRRRYGKRTFTWPYVIAGDGSWKELRGDPWPSVIVPRKDLEKIAIQVKESEESADHCESNGAPCFCPLCVRVNDRRKTNGPLF